MLRLLASAGVVGLWMFTTGWLVGQGPPDDGSVAERQLQVMDRLALAADRQWLVMVDGQRRGRVSMVVRSSGLGYDVDLKMMLDAALLGVEDQAAVADATPPIAVKSRVRIDAAGRLDGFDVVTEIVGGGFRKELSASRQHDDLVLRSPDNALLDQWRVAGVADCSIFGSLLPDVQVADELWVGRTWTERRISLVAALLGTALPLLGRAAGPVETVRRQVVRRETLTLESGRHDCYVVAESGAATESLVWVAVDGGQTLRTDTTLLGRTLTLIDEPLAPLPGPSLALAR